MSIKNVKTYQIGDKLTPKQQKWIDEYIKCDDYTTASRNAGYTGTDITLKIWDTKIVLNLKYY